MNVFDEVPAEKLPIQSITNVTLGSGQASTDWGELTVWLSRSFAPHWYADALVVGREPDAHARRREILFAVACAESYLLEWVRDEVLAHDFSRLNRYFPPGEKRGIIDKWKEIPRELTADGLVSGLPNLGTTTWRDFRGLVEMRNGLSHARASRPETSGLPAEEMPLPRISDLEALKPGEPTAIVRTLIEELASATGTEPPPWLKS